MRFNSKKAEIFCRKSRERGQVSAVIGFLSLVVLAVGLFSFEVGRMNLADQQLQNATDAATLACAATLTGEPNTDPTTAHNDAIQTALNLFKRNNIMSQNLTQTTVVTTTPNNPPPGNATLCFQFLDPITKAVVPISSANGKVVRIYSDFGVLPVFGAFLGLGAFDVHAVSNSAVPQLDIVICFDMSGSMDDQTPVTIVKRTWDAGLNQIVYDFPPSQYGTNGKIYDIMQPGPNGTSFNANTGSQPQFLSVAFANDGLFFSIPWCAWYGYPDLRSGGNYPDVGLPPGNYSATMFGSLSWDGYPVFTDSVVNIDGNASFGGISINGFNFPNLATLVEASRGNLENSTVFNSSMAYTSVGPTVTWKSGYQQQYFQAASQLVQPLNDAKAACSTFLNIINTDTDAHFGFVAFDSTVGTSATDTESRYNIDSDQFPGLPPFGVLTAYPRPMVPLDPTPGNNGYTTVCSALNSCVPIASTNIGLAVKTAVDQLKTNQRQGAVRAIVLFTDGQPDWGGPLDPDPWMNARDAAVLANNAGIPVYTVGLAQNAAVASGEQTILNDTDPSPTTGGIAAISGHGATFNQVTNSPQLTAVFEKIARCLVELVGSS